MNLQIALVLVIFFFFFLIYMFTKSWRWLDVVSVSLVFFTSIVFFFMAGFTLKTHETWHKLAQQQEAQLAEKLATIEELKWGPQNEIEQTQASLQSVKAALARAVIDRGRVWRNCVPGEVQYDPQQKVMTVTLQIPPRAGAAPAAGPAAGGEADGGAAPAAGNAPRHLMEEKIIVYAFKEQETDEGWKVPRFYLGEYFATNVTPTTVTLRSVVPPSQVDRALATQRDGTWALYEVMPVDGHHHFVNQTGEPLDDDALRALFRPEYVGLAEGLVTQEQYDRMLEQYRRDMGPAADDDLPERKWVEVKFVQNYQTPVDAAEPDVLMTENFDSQGRALNIQLQQGEATSFEIGDTVLMDAESAETLLAQGVVEKQGEKYVRRLRDYQYSFHEIYRRIVEIEEAVRNTNRDLATVNTAIEQTRQQIAARELEQTKLTQDRTKIEDELTKLQSYANTLTQFRDQLQGRLSALYRNNNQMERQLAAVQAELSEQIEARARQALAEASP